MKYKIFIGGLPVALYRGFKVINDRSDTIDIGLVCMIYGHEGVSRFDYDPKIDDILFLPAG